MLHLIYFEIKTVRLRQTFQIENLFFVKLKKETFNEQRWT